MSLVYYTYLGKQTSRLGGRVLGPWGIFDCIDGKLLLACVERHQWQRLIKVMDDPEWAHEKIFEDRLARERISDGLFPLIGEWTKDRMVSELFHTLQKARIPAAPVTRMVDVYADGHLRTRNFY